MSKLSILQNIPCTLVTGFLGSGKTTVINQLLNFKPINERWALLINEFGRIGIDGALLANAQSQDKAKSNIAISEVSGGCICCTSQLPLQVALSRLLTEQHPQRLIIEPTGLAHPRQLLRQLNAPHWQTALSMQAVVTVFNALQWQQPKYRSHTGYQAHVAAADVLVINRYQQLNKAELLALKAWISTLNTHSQIIWAKPASQDKIDSIDPNISDSKTSVDFDRYLSELIVPLTQPSVVINKTATANQNSTRINSSLINPGVVKSSSNHVRKVVADQPPYYYHDQRQDMLVGGWRLPAASIFDFAKLKLWLLQLPNWQRIKGLINTTEGWLQLNFTPDSLTIETSDAQLDNRLEIILAADTDSTQDKIEQLEIWDSWNSQLMALVVSSVSNLSRY